MTLATLPGRVCLFVITFLACTNAQVRAEDCVLVTNAYSARVGKIDTASHSLIATLKVADSIGVPTPNITTVVYDSIRQWAFVADHQAGAISAIDLATWTTSGPIVIPGMGKAPRGMAINDAGTRLYVGTGGPIGLDDSTNPLDAIAITGSTFPPTLTWLGSAPVGKRPVNVILSHDERYALVTCRNQSCLTVVDVATMAVAFTHNYPDTTYEPEGIDLHPTANLAYIFTHGQNTIDLFDLDSMRMVGSVPISNPTPPQPSGGAFSPDGNTVLVSCQTIGKVLVFNTADPRHPVQTPTVISVGPQPHKPLFLSATKAYVPNTNNTQPVGSISILSLSGSWVNTGQVVGTFNGPLGMTKAPSMSSSSPRLYLTFVSHNEEPGAEHPDYLSDKTFYLQNRELVRQLAAVMRSKGANWNFQSDWNFLKAAAAYDTGLVTGNTNGKNIVRWLVDDMGFEADPHAHESQYNYADVAYLHTELGVTPSGNVGGFLYDPPDNPQGWEQHEQGTWGSNYPTYFWRPDNLWGAATYMHQGNDDCSFGVWKPQDKYNFYLHDAMRHLTYIGGGGGYGFIQKLLAAFANNSLSDTGFYTATIFIPQANLNAAEILNISIQIDSLAPFVAQGLVAWSSLSQTGEIWRTGYGEKPYRLGCDDILAATCCLNRRGNVNGDAADAVNVLDITFLVQYLFKGGAALPCKEEADMVVTNTVNIVDLTFLVRYLFKSGALPASCP